MVIENTMGYSFHANHSLDGPMDAGGSENTLYTFLKFHPKIKAYFAPIQKKSET